MVCMIAASGGHLAVLQWARANGCVWDKLTCSLATQYGHLELLQWARANACPWPGDAIQHPSTGGDLCFSAARNGHLDVLQWLRAGGSEWDKLKCLHIVQDEGVRNWIQEQSA